MSSPLLAIPSPVIQTPETILLVPITYPSKKKTELQLFAFVLGFHFRHLLKKDIVEHFFF